MIDVSFAAADRLLARCRELFTFVGTVADFAALADMPRSMPAAYVLPIDERADQNDMLGINAQTHSATFGVVLIVRYAGDASGARATFDLGLLRVAVQDALVGWVPDNCCDSVQFVSGSLSESPAGGIVTWQDDFMVRRRVIH